MERKYDLIVIGGGLAGRMAALSAKTAANRVLLITKGAGSFYFGPGVIDLLGNKEGQMVLLPWQQLFELGGFHPYRRLGSSAVQQAMDFFVRLLAEENYPLIGSGQQDNMLLPTALGSIRPTWLAPPSLTQGDLRRCGAMKIIGFADFHFFSSQLVAENLAKGLGKQGLSSRIDWAVIPLGFARTRPVTAYDLAIWLENPQNLQQLIANLLPVLGQEECLGFPAVLGIKQHQSIIRQLETALGKKVFEIPTIPPSVPGIRLERALADLFRRREIEVITGYDVVGSRTDQERITQIQVDLPGGRKNFTADKFILAAGGLAGGGLLSGPGWLREPIFDLPVFFHPDVDCWTHADLAGPAGQPYAGFGLRVNKRLQPVDPTGGICFANLYAAGNIIAFFDPISEKSSAGTDIASGYWAGQNCRGEGENHG